MQFGYTILYVENVRQTLAFYEKAFGFATRFLDEDASDYGELETGSTALAFCSWKLLNTLHKNPQRANPQAPTAEIAFTTTDVQAALTRALAAGATLIKNVETMPWGQTIAYVADMNGFLVELCTPMGK